MSKTITFYTIGCRSNQAETASLETALQENGYTLIGPHYPCDIAVINTCTVTAKADSDMRHLVSKINRLNPKTNIVLIGCQVETQEDKLRLLPNVRLLIGNAQKMNLAKLLQDIQPKQQTKAVVSPIRRKSFTMPITKGDSRHTRANLKIQDGCDSFCSYCEVPYTRGRARSRVFEDIVKEAKALAASGHKEIILTGINLGMYRYKNKTLFDILDALEKIEGIRRVRISSIEMTTVPTALLKRMGTTKLCRFIHVPLQSASDCLLKKMNRKYTAGQFEDFIRRAYSLVPQLCIGTDIIVGFPGEAEEDFNTTYHFIEKLPFSYLHVFSYSARFKAKSRFFKETVTFHDMRVRSQKLHTLSRLKRTRYMKGLIPTRQHVLFEQKKGGYWTGLTDHYMRVRVKSNKKLQNCYLPVKIKQVDGQALRATLIR